MTQGGNGLPFPLFLKKESQEERKWEVEQIRFITAWMY